MNRSSQRGFTLIEIALALLVASIGLLSVFSLFPAGLQMNKTALDETQAAMFAETVLNGIRAQASTQEWSKIKTGIRLPPPTPDVWDDAAGKLFVQRTPGNTNTFVTNLFIKAGSMRPISGANKTYLDFGIRYRLEIDDVDQRRKAVRLFIRPGEYGKTETYVFYTELYNHGQ